VTANDTASYVIDNGNGRETDVERFTVETVLQVRDGKLVGEPDVGLIDADLRPRKTFVMK
jgi:hypothetical protein